MPIQDFDIYHGGSVGPPQGWVGATTGSGSITYNQDTQGGSVTLATGGTDDSKALLYLDTDILIPSQVLSFQCHLSAISAVTEIDIRVGFAPRASWAAMAAVGALAALPADYFLYETICVGAAANWFLKYQTGGSGAIATDSAVLAVVTTTKLIAMIDATIFPLGYVNGVPFRTNVSTEIDTTHLMAPGVLISNTSAADRTVTLDMISWEGNRT
jgi:hypothetical protein